MLRYPLIHPPLLQVLATAGHGAKILIADSNYAHGVNIRPGAPLIHLNLRPGLIASDDILETVLDAVPVEAAEVMSPDDGTTPVIFGRYEKLLGDEVPLRGLNRQDFYDACRQNNFAACIASGDNRLYANLLLTIGVVAP